jgi:SAM-dependent methyltransferase
VVGDLILTGERTLPGIEHENYWFRRHEVAYQELRGRVAGMRVVEAGSGEGYGAGLLREVAQSVVAVELDPAAVGHTRRTYPDVAPVRANLVALPFGAGTIDAVVHFQTIEHLWDQGAFVAECARVLRPGGLLLVTTPNTLTFPKGNPFHVRELTMPELVELLEDGGFEVTDQLGIRHRGLDDSLIDEQIAVPQELWSPELRRQVAAVTCENFEIGPFEPADLDLAVVARKP